MSVVVRGPRDVVAQEVRAAIGRLDELKARLVLVPVEPLGCQGGVRPGGAAVEAGGEGDAVQRVARVAASVVIDGVDPPVGGR